MPSYSVLLLYPDYMSDVWGKSYYSFVEANDPEQAVEVARQACMQANTEEGGFAGVSTPEDLACLLVIHGRHSDLHVRGREASMIAKAFGGEFNVPVVQLDLGAMKQKYLGTSEGNIHHAMKTMKALLKDLNNAINPNADAEER